MDDDLSYVRRNTIVHFGSHADTEQLGKSQSGSGGGNVQVSTEYLPMEEHTNPLDGKNAKQK